MCWVICLRVLEKILWRKEYLNHDISPVCPPYAQKWRRQVYSRTKSLPHSLTLRCLFIKVWLTTSRKTSQSGMKLDNLTHLLHLTIRLQAQKSDLVNIPKAVPSPRHGSIVTKLTVTSNAEINLQE